MVPAHAALACPLVRCWRPASASGALSVLMAARFSLADSDALKTFLVTNTNAGFEKASAAEEELINTDVFRGCARTQHGPVPSSAKMIGAYAVASSAGGAGVDSGSCTFTSLKVWAMTPFAYDTSLCADKGCLYP